MNAISARSIPRVTAQTHNDFLIDAGDRCNEDNVAYAVALGEPPEFLVAQFRATKKRW